MTAPQRPASNSDARKRAGEPKPGQKTCRTCLRPITHETRTEAGRLPREGWYDDCRRDPIVCFKAIDYRHVPLEGRELAYYEAGYKSGYAARTSS